MTALRTDAHLHLWDLSRSPYAWMDGAPSLRRTGTWDLVRDPLRALGVQRMVLVQADDTAEDTRLLHETAAAIEADPGSAVRSDVVGWMPLADPGSVEDLLAEAAATPRLVGVRCLIHGHADAGFLDRPGVGDSLELLARAGVDASFDAYPYTRGCSLLGMTLLPPALNAMDPAAASALLRDPAQREQLRRDWLPGVAAHPSLGPDWPEQITLAHLAAEQHAWAHGLTLAEVAARRGTDPLDAALDLLADSALEVNVVMAVRNERPVEDLGRLLAHPRHLGGSDGIFIGAHPHPRARGTFPSYLGTYAREHGFLTWPQAVQHLSRGAVERFRLGARGAVRARHLADLVLVDPQSVTDRATYEDPLALAEGIEDVLVAGRPVLAGGELTGELPGRGLRASSHTSSPTAGSSPDV